MTPYAWQKKDSSVDGECAAASPTLDRVSYTCGELRASFDTGTGKQALSFAITSRSTGTEGCVR